LEAVERVTCLKVPLDILPPEALAETINRMAATGESCHIVLLSLWDLLRARKSGEYRSYVLSASLVIPISKSIIGGVRFLTGKSPVRYMPFDFVVKTLTALEERGRSVYLLGSRRKSLQTAERNIKHTFPGLRIVGRFTGGFRRQDEEHILKGVRKAAPTLLLIAKGVAGDERWIARNDALLSSGIRLWCSDLFDIFAERKSRPSRKTFDRGMEGFVFFLRNPLRFFLVFPYSYYKILLLYYKLFKRE
jgi:N-acetylglucosaminyldiphosphoundecaprenol N-acetyl-beta-D-mannosaminyltransferase